MQISLSKFTLFLTGLISLGLVLGTGYILFKLFFDGVAPDDVPVLTISDTTLFGNKFQKAAAAIVDPASKINLDKDKDLQFLNSPLFLSFTVDPSSVPLSEARGRDNPFVPLYVTP